MLTPVFAQSSPHRSRESAAIVRSVPIQIGPPSSSEGRGRTVFSCLRDCCVGAACAHRLGPTVQRYPRVFCYFPRIFRRKPPVFYSFLPVFRRLLSCARTLPASMAERCSRSSLRRVLCWPAADRFGECARRGVQMPAGVSGSFRASTVVRAGAADVLLRRDGTVLGAVRRESARSVAPVHKKAGRRKVYVCRRGEVQCSAVRNRASRGARLITPSRVCGFSACH